MKIYIITTYNYMRRRVHAFLPFYSFTFPVILFDDKEYS